MGAIDDIKESAPAERLGVPPRQLFPYFGGKAEAAAMVWSRLGKLNVYIEPFFGSGAVLFRNPHPPSVEIVNDASHFVVNFWRAIKFDASAVASYADWPLMEADLHARHYWLITEGANIIRDKICLPDFYDAKVAGWWAWCMSASIGNVEVKRGAWLATESGWVRRKDGGGISRSLPFIARPRGSLGIRFLGRGPGYQGALEALLAYYKAFQRRLENAIVCCGDWSRVVNTRLFGSRVVGIFLDPPYKEDGTIDTRLYSCGDGRNVAESVSRWCIENGDNPRVRIALCGYEGSYDMPPTWECVPWKTRGGFHNFGRNRRNNRFRERVWFSPHCLKPTEALCG